MVDLLLTWVKDPGVDMKERVRIAQDMLDRSGHGATSKHLHGLVTSSGNPVDRLFLDLLTTPGALVDATEPYVKAPPSEWNLEVMEADPAGFRRVIPGEVEVTPRQIPSRPEEPTPAPMPPHIRRALEELL